MARLSAATAAEAGVADGDLVTVATDRGSVTLPLEVVADMPDRRGLAADADCPAARRVAPYPGDADPRPGRAHHPAQLGAGHGATVTLRRPE